MLKNMKIRTRLLASYALIIVLSLVASVVSLFMLQKVGNNLNEFYEQNFAVTTSAWAARRNIQSVRASILQSMLETGSEETQACLADASNDLSSMKEAVAVVGNLFQGDSSLVTQIESAISEAAPYRIQVMELATANKNAEAFEIMTNSYTPYMDKVVALLTEITAVATNNSAKMVQNSTAATTTSTVVVLSIAAISILSGIFIATIISKSISVPILQVQTAAQGLSEGRLDHSMIVYEAKDELGTLSDAMRTTMAGLSTIISDISFLMKELSEGNFSIRTKNEAAYKGEFRPIILAMREMKIRVNDTLVQIDQSANQVSSGSEQVASGSQALSQGATEQASSVEELAATISDISEQIRENAQSAQEASEKANDVNEQMDASNRQMTEMQQAMTEIADKASQISKIIKTIDDISFQTNILSLNAAVEAARAGAAGKGFAVVASEVKQLAEKSSDAAKDTTALIESTVTAVERGAKISESTASSLQSSVSGVRETVSIIEKISLASQKQATSIEQVNQGVNQISAVVQTNSATAEESAASSEELSGQANLLKSLVSRFRLEDSSSL